MIRYEAYQTLYIDYIIIIITKESGGNMANKDIRQAIKNAGLKHYQVAQVMGVHENTLVRLLRFELGLDDKGKVLAAIEKAKVEFKKGE